MVKSNDEMFREMNEQRAKLGLPLMPRHLFKIVIKEAKKNDAC